MSDLLTREETSFVLWRPGLQDPPPRLVIGQLQTGNPPSFTGERRLDLRRATDNPDLWEIAASECGLTQGEIFHYWFEISDSDPRLGAAGPQPRILCTDPLRPSWWTGGCWGKRAVTRPAWSEQGQRAA